MDIKLSSGWRGEFLSFSFPASEVLALLTPGQQSCHPAVTLPSHPLSLPPPSSQDCCDYTASWIIQDNLPISRSLFNCICTSLLPCKVTRSLDLGIGTSTGRNSADDTQFLLPQVLKGLFKRSTLLKHSQFATDISVLIR